MTNEEADKLWESSKGMIKHINSSSKKILKDEEDFEKRQKLLKVESKRAATKRTLVRTSIALLGITTIWYLIADYQVKKKYGDPYNVSSANSYHSYGPDMVYDIEGEELSRFEANVREMPTVVQDLFNSLSNNNEKSK
ncbi:MAG TPA: hypothetical protein PLT65_02625 [Bacilli bacterium]|nr:hypothetical protein [Bacilli bacterium]